MWSCKASYCSNVAKLSGYVDVKSQSEDDLLDAVANVGPVWLVQKTTNVHVSSMFISDTFIGTVVLQLMHRVMVSSSTQEECTLTAAAVRTSSTTGF